MEPKADDKPAAPPGHDEWRKHFDHALKTDEQLKGVLTQYGLSALQTPGADFYRGMKKLLS